MSDHRSDIGARLQDGYWLILPLQTAANLCGSGAFLSVSMSVMADVSATLSHAGRTNMLMLLEAATWCKTVHCSGSS